MLAAALQYTVRLVAVMQVTLEAKNQQTFNLHATLQDFWMYWSDPIDTVTADYTQMRHVNFLLVVFFNNWHSS